MCREGCVGVGVCVEVGCMSGGCKGVGCVCRGRGVYM